MERAARGGWTDEQILSALQARDGGQEIHFRADVLRDGLKQREIHIEGSVAQDRLADITRTASFVMYEEIDWLREEIKPIMLLRMPDGEIRTVIDVANWAAIDALWYTWQERDSFGLSWDALEGSILTCAEWEARQLTWDRFDALGLSWTDIDHSDHDDVGKSSRMPEFAEFSLGVFIPSTPRRSSVDGVNTWEVEAYDRAVILKEDSLTETLYIADGTQYLTAVQNILVSAGISEVLFIDYVDTALPAPREFEIGTKKIEAINTLLTEINFDTIYCDTEGRFVIQAYKEPTPSGVTFAYKADAQSIISRDTQSEADFYNTPNVFLGSCSNPDMDESYYSEYVNDNPASILSTVYRNRRIVANDGAPYEFEQIASLEELDAAVRKQAFEESQVDELFIFQTALNPLHGRKEVLLISHPDGEGVFPEDKWAIDMRHDGQMSHETRRLVLI